MKFFEMVVRVPEKQLVTVIEVVKGAAQLVSLREVEEGETPKKKGGREPKTDFYANGKRNKGIKGTDLMMQLLEDGKPHTTAELGKSFEHNGFKSDSVSPVLSELATANKVEALGRGVWRKMPVAAE